MKAGDRQPDENERAASTPRRRRRHLWIALGVLVLLLALYAIAGFVVLPWWVQNRLPERVEAQTGLVLNMESVRANPFFIAAEMRGVSLAPRDEPPILSAHSASADLSLASLFARAWVIDELRVDGAHVRLPRAPGGGFELPLADRGNAEQAESDDSGTRDQNLPALRLQNAAFSDSRIDIIPAATDDPQAISVTAINLEAESLDTTDPEATGHYRLEATLPDGGGLRAEGSVALLAAQSSGRFSLRDAALAPWWPLVRDEWTLSSPEGRLGITSNYRVSFSDGELGLVLDALALRADALVLARENEDPMLALQRVSSEGGRFDLAARTFSLRGVRALDGEVHIAVDAEGELNWGGLRHEQEEEPVEDAAGWQVDLGDAAFQNVQITYADRGLDGVRVQLGNLNGSLDATIDTGSEDTRVHVSNGRGRVDALTYTKGDARPLEIDAVALDGARLDTRDRLVAAESAAAQGITLLVVIDEQGNLQLPAGLLGTDESDAPPWEYAAGEFVVGQLALALEDRRYTPPLEMDLAGRARVSDIARGASTPMALSATFTSGNDGRLQVDGELAQDFSQASARVGLADFELAVLQPLVGRYTTLRVGSGAFGGALDVDFRAEREPSAVVDGELELSSFRLDQEDYEEPLFSGPSLRATGSVEIAPLRVLVKQIVVDKATARVLINSDREFNLARIAREVEQPDVGEGGDTENTENVFRVERIDIHEATVDFSDESLVLPFSTQIEGLSGGIAGVDSSPDAEAVLDAEGRVPPHGAAITEGRVRPFAPRELTDITVRFDNIEMPQLTPYSATFAGRAIASGRLWLDLRYRIVDGQLDGLNGIILEDFTLGERVEDPTSLDAPLELALALLRDPDGRVTLEVPIAGDLDDPEFDYQNVIRSAIGNILQRIVSAPFRFLAGLVGGGQADDAAGDDGVGFEPGSDRLSPAEQERLDGLAEALAQRPQLSLSVRGTYNASEDDEALRLEAARREIEDAAGVAAPDDEHVGPIDFGHWGIQAAVAERYEALAGPGAVDEFRGEFKRRGGESPDEQGETALHREMFERLAQREPLPPQAREELAIRRAEMVRDYLVEQGGVARERIEIADVEPVEDGEPLETKLNLEVAEDR